MSLPTTQSNSKDIRELWSHEVDSDGAHWYRDAQDRLHRNDGPAVIHADGVLWYFNHGKPHREDGPAFVFANGTGQYWVDGKPMTEEEFNARKNLHAI